MFASFIKFGNIPLGTGSTFNFLAKGFLPLAFFMPNGIKNKPQHTKIVKATKTKERGKPPLKIERS